MANISKPIGYPDEPNDAISRAVRGYAEGGRTGDSGGIRNDVTGPKKGTKGNGPKKGPKDGPKGNGPKGNGPKGNGPKDGPKGGKKTGKNSVGTNKDFTKGGGKNVTPVNDDKKYLQNYIGGAIKDLVGQNDYIKDQLLNQGYIDESGLTKQFYDAIRGMQGSPTMDRAQDMTKDVYSAYGDAGDYDKTRYDDIERRFANASNYDKYNYNPIMNSFDRAENYDKTNFSDLERKALNRSDYDTGKFSDSDYTANNLKKYMDPYEKLVADRQKERAKQDYNEGRGGRESEAVRQGAFGGSEAAVKEMRARRDLDERMKDIDAESLQAAFKSAGGLYGAERGDTQNAEQMREQSRQYGAGLGLQGLEQASNLRKAESDEEARKREFMMQGAQGKLATGQASAAENAKATDAKMAGINGILNAREQTAQETARAKDAELQALAGQAGASQLLGNQAAQDKQMDVTDASMLQKGGASQMDYDEKKLMFPQTVLGNAASVIGVGGSNVGTLQNGSQSPTLLDNIVGGIGLVGSAAQTATNVGNAVSGLSGLFAAGGEVQRPSMMVNLANGGIVDLHNSMFRKK